MASEWDRVSQYPTRRAKGAALKDPSVFGGPRRGSIYFSFTTPFLSIPPSHHYIPLQLLIATRTATMPSHILDNALGGVGHTPLVRLDKIAQANDLKCNLRKQICSKPFAENLSSLVSWKSRIYVCWWIGQGPYRKGHGGGS